MSEAQRRLLRRLALAGAAAAAGAAVWLVAGGYGLPRPETLADFFNEWRTDPDLAPWLPYYYVTFIAVCAASTFPRAIVILAATAAFGPLKATALTTLGGTIGASAAFLIARYLARDYIQARLPDSWRKWERRISERGFPTILILRTIPMSPMSTPHYGSGLTRMRLSSFVAASFLGFIPSTLFYVFFSATLIEIYKRYFDLPYVLPALVTIQVIAVAVVIVLYRRRRAAERRAEAAGEESAPGAGERSPGVGAETSPGPR